MSSIEIFLPDGKALTFSNPPTVLEVAQKIGAGLAKATLGAKFNGFPEIVDLREIVPGGTKIEIITSKSPEGLEVIRHSAAHVMAQAVQSIWPDVKVTIGPVVENGFYYDFDSPRTFSPDDFEKIEKKMGEIIAKDLEIRRENIAPEEAKATFAKLGEKFKLELIDDIVAKTGTKTVGIYHNGDEWFDLCRGPHVQRTGQIKAVKLMSIAGAYWRADETREQLQRVYATAFADKKDLDLHLSRLEEAKKRDHRKLGKDLGLFMFHPYAPGSPFFTGKGAIIYNELVGLMRDLYREFGYQEVITPQVFDVELFKTSGHFQNYRENMYFAAIDKSAQKDVIEGADERQASMKPMNCPSHCLMFAADKHSYRDLPLRIADFGRLHRFERSGVMHGLTRVRTFCQDDAHIFCRPDQMQAEIVDFMKLTMKTYEILGMTEFKLLVATRPESRMGSDEVWDQAEGALMKGLESLGLQYGISPGEGAFYGPKVEIHFVDAIGRSWQLGTIQIDYNLPEAFGLEYVGDDNQAHRPVMLHRAILGSLERFIGVYLEHTSAKLPSWLAPQQVVIMNLTDKQDAYAQDCLKKLRALGVRAEYDSRNEKLGYKIREAQLQKVPYMLVVGDQEVQNGTVTVRL
ncbi:MAG: threonine--tRNA ligase, partial [Bdellovibrionales bacterium]|nr:threonine--tRNA ligase [Bdellovibrionales bacterium]